MATMTLTATWCVAMWIRVHGIVQTMQTAIIYAVILTFVVMTLRTMWTATRSVGMWTPALWMRKTM
jgi:hypothetical protein